MELINSGKYLTVLPKNVHAEEPTKNVLSKEQLNFYNENGYLVIKELFDFASLYNYKKRFIHIVKGLVDKGHITIFKEPSLVAKGVKGEAAINKIQDIHFDEVLGTYCEDPRLLDVVSQLIGDSITAVHCMLINKPPGTGRHPPHQDMYYFPFRPADKIVAAWTAIDHVNEDNGCLYAIPRSHRENNILAHAAKSDTKLYHTISDESLTPEQRKVHLTMSPGDTVLFHPLLIHGSSPNLSQNYRKAITCHFASGDCHYVAVEGTVQEQIAREIEDIARRKKKEIKYQDTWHFKNKLVRGVKSNL